MALIYWFFFSFSPQIFWIRFNFWILSSMKFSTKIHIDFLCFWANEFPLLFEKDTIDFFFLSKKKNPSMRESQGIKNNRFVFNKYTWCCEYTRFAFGCPSRQTDIPMSAVDVWHIRYNTIYTLAQHTNTSIRRLVFYTSAYAVVSLYACTHLLCPNSPHKQRQHQYITITSITWSWYEVERERKRERENDLILNELYLLR